MGRATIKLMYAFQGSAKMGEWSEYFEDFPDENPANYIGGRFDPKGAEAQRETQRRQEEELRQDQAELDAEISKIKKSNVSP